MSEVSNKVNYSYDIKININASDELSKFSIVRHDAESGEHRSIKFKLTTGNDYFKSKYDSTYEGHTKFSDQEVKSIPINVINAFVKLYGMLGENIQNISIKKERYIGQDGRKYFAGEGYFETSRDKYSHTNDNLEDGVNRIINFISSKIDISEIAEIAKNGLPDTFITEQKKVYTKLGMVYAKEFSPN